MKLIYGITPLIGSILHIMYVLEVHFGTFVPFLKYLHIPACVFPSDIIYVNSLLYTRGDSFLSLIS